MRAALILYLARTSRFATADSLNRNERATSSTLRPPSSRRVKPTWCSVRSAGWQQVKISRSRSSPTDPFLPLSAPSDVRANTPSCSWSSRPRAERRRSSIARFRAVVTIHPARVGWHAVLPPSVACNDERFLHGVFGERDVAEETDQRRHRPAVRLAEHPFDGGHFCTSGDDGSHAWTRPVARKGRTSIGWPIASTTLRAQARAASRSSALMM